MWRLFIWIALLLNLKVSAEPVPRVCLALWDSKLYEDLFYSKPHQLLEMPLNYKGYVVEYVDVRAPLPDLTNRSDVVAIISWFPKYFQFQEPKQYLEWLHKAMEKDIKFILFGSPGLYSKDKAVSSELIDKFWRQLGLAPLDKRLGDVFQAKVEILDPPLFAFERGYVDPLLPFFLMETVGKSKIHLQAQIEGKTYPLVVTSEKGAWISDSASFYEEVGEGNYFRKWYLNPFLLVSKILDEEFPKPDPTTLFGRRVFYSHIDGDGWNSYAEMERYKNDKVLAPKVVFEEILKKNPDLPVTVAIIGAELDPDWIGTEESKEVAKEIFRLPHIDAASHTYSHPFFWQFFENYDQQKEVSCLYKYPYGGFVEENLLTKIQNRLEGGCEAKVAKDSDEFKDWSAEELRFLVSGYSIPRAYANHPFNLIQEIEGSCNLVQTLLPQGKKVELIQWSGNCEPFLQALEKSSEVGVQNLNGGDSRFDSLFPSYAWVRPLGRCISKYRQIYASCSNENTYTNMWRENFWGFSMLPQTWENTEKPLRIKPLNLYYHMYSGTKEASLGALQGNIKILKEHNFIAISAKKYTRMADGFYTAQLEKQTDGGWKITERQDLQTIRFDEASTKYVNLEKSNGVIGMSHLHGSLYVFLDASTKEPVIYLQDEKPKLPYLAESSWSLSNLQRTPTEITFKADGFGDGFFRFIVQDGTWIVNGNEVKAEGGVLEISAKQPGEITLKRRGDS